MRESKQLANVIIDSIKNYPHDWVANGFVSINEKLGIEIWIMTRKKISISVNRNARIVFSLRDRKRIQRALCKICTLLIVETRT